jgi:hypothetical protein
MEALYGVKRLAEFTSAYHRLLDQFAMRTSKLVLLSPMPFEKPEAAFAPDLTKSNADVAVYVEAIRKIAAQRGAIFVDLYTPLKDQKKRLTTDGIHLHEPGLRTVARVIGRSMVPNVETSNHVILKQAIVQKNQLWFDCWRPANWSFAYGDRVNQRYGKGGGNLPSLQKDFEDQLEYVELVDKRIHHIARGEIYGPLNLPKITPTHSEGKALSVEEQLKTFTVANPYEVNLFASEADGIINPTQISWDEKGRLYVACSPGYPQLLGDKETAGSTSTPFRPPPLRPKAGFKALPPKAIS